MRHTDTTKDSAERTYEPSLWDLRAWTARWRRGFGSLRRAQSSLQSSRWSLPALIFVVALLPRLVPVGRYVTPDEPVWVHRSIRFSQALAAGDLDAVPATGHPGVTTMWLGALGLQIHRWLAPDLAALHLDWVDGLAGISPKSAAAFRHLAFFLSGGRVLVALSTSLGLVVVYGLARRLWGGTAAALGALLLALDPFLAGHSGLLHLDGLLATTMTLSALTALLAVCPPRPPLNPPRPRGGSTVFSPHPRGGSTVFPPRETGGTAPEGGQGGESLYRWFTLSGLLGGLALLTKTPGGFLAPFVGFLLATAWLTRRIPISWRQTITALALWVLAAGLTFLALYPALWADPVATLRGLLDVGGRHVEGALRPIFFHGETTYDPGVAFYPVVWLFRASPMVLVGLPLALVTHLRRPGPRRFAVVALTALALGFGLFVTLVGKKHDRYLLPVFPPLTLVATLGWEGAGKLVKGKLVDWGRTTNLSIPGLPIHSLPITALVLAQLFFILPYLSTPLGYFNPLLGGPRVALDWLPVGWGEGLGAAARWLNQQPEAERLIVATPSIPPFASLFDGQTALLSQETLSQADYVVRLPRQGEDQFPSEGEAQVPLYDHRVGGISHASVSRNPAPRQQAAYLSDRASQRDLIVLDAEAALTRLYDGPADLVALADAGDPVQVAARLASLVPGRENLWYVASPAASPITARHIKQHLACYGQPVTTDTIAGVTIVRLICPGGRCQGRLTNVSQIPLDETCNLQHSTRFGEALALTDAWLPDSPLAWPDALPFVVRWEALAPLPADYGVAWHLKDDAGHTWVEGGQEILNADYLRPTVWAPGDWSDQTFKLALPPAIPPGRYTVELDVFDLASEVRLSAWDTGFAGLVVSLGQVSIAPPPHSPTPWDLAIGERFDPPPFAGPLALLGYNPPPARVASGDRVSFDLFWQATTAPGADYVLRWRLFSAEGDAGLTETVPLSPYPTARWRDQELEQVRYDLPASPDLPAGDYALAVNVMDASGVSLWSDDFVLAQVEILARDRLFSLPQEIAYPLDLRLGTMVHLRGFDLLQQAQDDRGTLAVGPGEQIALTLYWQADGPTDLSYTVFVHLVGPDTMQHGQVDRPPADGAAPTHSWAPGQVIVDEITLPVLADAPPGAYYIAVGLYDPISGDRLSVYDATGAELPNRQIVLPVEVTVE